MSHVEWLNRSLPGGLSLRQFAEILWNNDIFTPPRDSVDYRGLLRMRRELSEKLGVDVTLIPKMPFARGNSKVGSIWSFDLPPVLTCPFATFCGKKGAAGLYKGPGLVCYDIGVGRRSIAHLVREYLNFLYLARRGCTWLEGWMAFVVRYKKLELLRYHVGGDIFTDWYWECIKRIAYRFRSVTFYLYTRSFPIIAKSPERPSNLVVLMSLDGANYSQLEKYGEYFDHITYLVAGSEVSHQIDVIKSVKDWALQRGKRLVIFIENTRRKKLLTQLNPLKEFICPQERGESVTCLECKICFTKNEPRQ